MELFEMKKDIDDVNEGINEFDDNSYGPCFTVNFGLWLYRYLQTFFTHSDKT